MAHLRVLERKGSAANVFTGYIHGGARYSAILMDLDCGAEDGCVTLDTFQSSAIRGSLREKILKGVK